MIRSRSYPWGFPWLAARHQRDAEVGNVLVIFMFQVLETLQLHPTSRAGYIVLIFAEHPEDLGIAWREEDQMLIDPASTWQLDRMRALVATDLPLRLFTLVFNQCCWGAPYRKPTRLLTNLLPLREWGPCQWPIRCTSKLFGPTDHCLSMSAHGHPSSRTTRFVDQDLHNVRLP